MNLHFGILKVGQSMAQLLDFRLFLREPVVYHGINTRKNRKGREISGNQLLARACCLLPKRTREQTCLDFRAGEQFCPQKSSTYSLQNPTYQRNPVHPQKNPVYPQKNPVHPQKSPVHPQKSPVHLTKALYLRKRALCIRKRALCIRKRA